jgi:hypothetical protein
MKKKMFNLEKSKKQKAIIFLLSAAHDERKKKRFSFSYKNDFCDTNDRLDRMIER